MLFRADFVRQKHVPGSIETNHGSLSKIIGEYLPTHLLASPSSPLSTIPGNCWRALPLEEKRVWEIRAKKAKEEHAVMYPGYRFRPVHNKDKSKKKTKTAVTLEDEERCEAVAQLLLEGKKGDELAAAIRRLDQRTTPTAMPAPHPVYPHRRSSSVPLPDSHSHPIALPALPFLQMGSRSGSPVGNISRSARMLMGQRRPSSVQPIPSRSWGTISPVMFSQHDVSPLPDVDSTLFDPAFLDAGFSMRADSSFVSRRSFSLRIYPIQSTPSELQRAIPTRTQHPVAQLYPGHAGRRSKGYLLPPRNDLRPLLDAPLRDHRPQHGHGHSQQRPCNVASCGPHSHP